jgi:DNA-binding winged helix-turn-helix (wHTH) protein
VLVLAADGSWFRTPDGERVDISRRESLRGILRALGRLRLESPGEALGRDKVIDAGWPGERILKAAAGNRLRVAIATLRKLGLGDSLVTHEAGHSLSAAVPVILV